MSRWPLSVRLAEWSVASAVIAWSPGMVVERAIGSSWGYGSARTLAYAMSAGFLGISVILLLASAVADWREGPETQDSRLRAPDPQGERLICLWLVMGGAAVIAWMQMSGIGNVEAR